MASNQKAMKFYRQKMEAGKFCTSLADGTPRLSALHQGRPLLSASAAQQRNPESIHGRENG